MKLLEKIFGGLIIILMISSMLVHYPYSSALITLFSVLLASLYFYFGFLLLNSIRFRHAFKKSSYSEFSVSRILGTIFAGFALSILVIYILFKFQRWPYGQQGLIISLCLLSLLIVAVLIKYFTTKTRFYFNLFVRLCIFGIIGTIMYLVSHQQLLEIKYRNHPEYLKAELELLNDPENKILQQKASEERQKIYTITN